MQLIPFFENYAQLFLQEDAEKISELYSFPMTFYSEEGTPISFDRDAFTENSKKLINLYNSLRVKKVSFFIENETLINTNLLLVTVKWDFRRNDNTTIYDATTHYLFSTSDGDLKIIAIFVVDESTKLKELTT